MSDKNMSTRRTPPQTEEEHAHVWDAVDKAHKAWVVVAPIYHAVTNRKALAIVIGAILASNGRGLFEFGVEVLERWLK